MQTLHKSDQPESHSSDEWLIQLNNFLSLTDQTMHPVHKTNLSCRQIEGRTHLYLPSEMAEFQPDVLRYLHALGSANDFTLVEDRRKVAVQPVKERRAPRPSDLAIGVSLLLKQTGLPGPAHNLSSPHRLNAGNTSIDLPTLIRMTSKLHTQSKKVVFLPNRFITGNFQVDAEPMTGYACKSTCDTHDITLCYFNAPDFRAIGYSSGDQFVLHVLLAGGCIASPGIWSTVNTLNSSSFRCQVFKSPAPAADFGLLYNTFYLDLEQSMEQQQWWAGTFNNTLTASGG